MATLLISTFLIFLNGVELDHYSHFGLVVERCVCNGSSDASVHFKTMLERINKKPCKVRTTHTL